MSLASSFATHLKARVHELEVRLAEATATNERLAHQLAAEAATNEALDKANHALARALVAAAVSTLDLGSNVKVEKNNDAHAHRTPTQEAPTADSPAQSVVSMAHNALTVVYCDDDEATPFELLFPFELLSDRKAENGRKRHHERRVKARKQVVKQVVEARARRTQDEEEVGKFVRRGPTLTSKALARRRFRENIGAA
jgi:hypothetical protein